METKFNFNSQICTTREQSELLLALGLKKETADMTIHIKKDDGWHMTAEPFYEWEDDINIIPSSEDIESILPAWSLLRLLSMLPDDAPKIYWILDGASITIEFEDDNSDFFPHKGDIYEGVVKCIEWLIKEGYFNKRYLV